MVMHFVKVVALLQLSIMVYLILCQSHFKLREMAFTLTRCLAITLTQICFMSIIQFCTCNESLHMKPKGDRCVS